MVKFLGRKIVMKAALLTSLIMLLGSSLFASPVVATEIAVVVNPGNPIENLNQEDVRRIFLGKLRNFTTGKKLHVSNLPEDAPLREEFYQRLTGHSAKKAKSQWAAYAFSGLVEFPQECSDEAELISWVNQNEEGIGYISAAAVSDRVKVVYRFGAENN